MKFRRTSVLILSGIMLAACSSDGEKTLEHPAALNSFEPTLQLEPAWHFRVGASEHEPLPPTVTREAIFAVNGHGVLFKIDRLSGKPAWQIKSGFDVSGGVGVGEGLVFLGGMKGQLAAYRQNDGALQWQVKVSSEVVGAPRVSGGFVVVRTGDGRMAALNVADGSPRWLYERATPALVARSNAGMVIREGVVFAGFPAGKVAAISLENGVIIWESAVSQPRGATELERISDVTSLPVVDDKQVCAVAFQGRVACFEDDRGGTLWTREFSSDKGLTLSRRYVYLTDSTGHLMALDKLTGTTLWKNESLHLRGVTAPVASEKYVAVGDSEGYLHLFGREEGKLLGRIKTDGSAILSAPLLLDDKLLVQTAKGELYSMVIR